MSDFYSCAKVRAAKQHRCEQCRKPIEVGTMHWKSAQVHDGEFGGYREHFECRAAWSTLNYDIRDIPRYEGAPFLCDDEHDPDDRPWMVEQFPVVAERLGWTA